VGFNAEISLEPTLLEAVLGRTNRAGGIVLVEAREELEYLLMRAALVIRLEDLVDEMEEGDQLGGVDASSVGLGFQLLIESATVNQGIPGTGIARIPLIKG
jgi:hypothetical protein